MAQGTKEQGTPQKAQGLRLHRPPANDDDTPPSQPASPHLVVVEHGKLPIEELGHDDLKELLRKPAFVDAILSFKLNLSDHP